MSATILSRINYGLSDVRGDFFGGLTASSIALPVALGYGVISGLGPVAGLYGAVAVGIFASIFGGVRGMVYGSQIMIVLPMSVVVAEYADSIAQAATIGILVGLLQIVFGLLGLGRYASYIPFSLTSGFFTAFGFLLIIKQSLLAFGASSGGGGVIATFKALPDAIADLNSHALALTVVCLALGVLWRGRLLRLCPAPFVVLVAGFLVGAFWLKEAPTVGEIPTGLPAPDMSAFSLDFFLRAAQLAFIMALLSSVGTLVTALRLDAITGSQHHPNREMIAQGMGNIATGSIGGLAGSAGQGTFANVYSGGRSPVAGLIVAVVILLVIFAMGPIAERVPFAVLAAILMMNAWNIIDWRFLTHIHRVSKSYAFVMLLTCALVWFVDFVAAIVIGLVVAGLLAARRVENLEVRELISVPLLDRAVLGSDFRDDDDPFQARSGIVVFPERVTVASAREISRIVRPDIRGHQIVIFDMSRTVYADDSASQIIGELVQIAMAQRSRTFIVAGLTDDVSNTLHSMGLLDKVPKENFAADMDEAMQIVRSMLKSQE